VRVTNRQFVNLMARSVNISSQRLLKAQERLATMKRINRPSDDPIGMNRVLDYRRRVASVEQYMHNIDTAKIRVEATVGNLEDVHELLRQARDIAASQASANDPTGRITAVRQIAHIYDQVRDIANTRLGGSYLFAGHDTDTLPFPRDEVTAKEAASLEGGEHFTIQSSETDYYVWYDVDNASSDPQTPGRTGIEVDISSGDTAEEVAAATQAAINAVADFSAAAMGEAVVIRTAADGEAVDACDADTGFGFYNRLYNGDSGTIRAIVGEGIHMKINVHGNEVFTGSGVADGVDVFAVLKEVKTALESQDFDAPSLARAAEDLGKAVFQVETVVSEQSTAFKRLEQTQEYWNHMKQKFEDVLSKTEDADAAQVAVELQAQETAYETALTAASNALKRNLLDFLA